MLDDENFLGSLLRFQFESELFLQCREDRWLRAVRIVGRSYRGEFQVNFERARESRPVNYWPAKQAFKNASEPLHRNFLIGDQLGRHVHPSASILSVGMRSL